MVVVVVVVVVVLVLLLVIVVFVLADVIVVAGLDVVAAGCVQGRASTRKGRRLGALLHVYLSSRWLIIFVLVPCPLKT